MKKQLFSTALIGLFGLSISACGITDKIDEAKEDIEEVKASINSKLSEAERTAEGLLEDPELRDSAMTLLKTVIPDSLAISSVLAEVDNGQGFDAKISRLDSVLSKASQESDPIKGVTGCLRALPAKMDTWGSPLCYGPSLVYNNEAHPDNNGQMQQNPTNPPMTNNDPMQMQGNQLPGGDLGIWEEKQGEKLACSAAKLNQLSHNTAIYSDLATGSMAMMVCVSAFAGDTLPGLGETLDVSKIISKIQTKAKFGDKGMQITTATVTNTDKGYDIDLVGTFKERPFSIRTLHNASEKMGAISVIAGPATQEQTTNDQGPQNPQMSNWRATSLKYRRSEGKTNFRMISSAQSDSSTAVKSLSNQGEVSTKSTDFIGDLNIAQGSMSTKGGHMAFGWQAGSGDGFLRVFNASTDGELGHSWFGYSKNDNSNDIRNLLKIDGMICNWAGPGNSHTPKLLAQKQVMERVDKRLWVPTTSNILYAPTNSCDVDNTDLKVFPTMTDGEIKNNLLPLSDYSNSFNLVEVE